MKKVNLVPLSPVITPISAYLSLICKGGGVKMLGEFGRNAIGVPRFGNWQLPALLCSSSGPSSSDCTTSSNILRISVRQLLGNSSSSRLKSYQSRLFTRYIPSLAAFMPRQSAADDEPMMNWHYAHRPRLTPYGQTRSCQRLRILALANSSD